MMHRRHFVTLLASLAPAGLGTARSPSPAEPWTEARRYLLQRQSPDGSWRSDVYGGFETGAALTPLVTLALSPVHRAAAEAGVTWLLGHHEECLAAYPVHNASFILQLSRTHQRLAPLVAPLSKRLCELQLGSRRGWKDSHRAFGGWGYFGMITPWTDGIMLAPMQESNLSPTVIAVAGLQAAGLDHRDRTLAEAGHFIRQCQNFREGGPPGPHDDGGFFQMQGDVHRNKAGSAGPDKTGTERFRSYSAATADGLRGLLMTGTAPDHPRAMAAITWLRGHPAPNDVPHLEFYSAQARREAERTLGKPLPAPTKKTPRITLPQNPDGSWKNPAGEYREDDPLIATAMALIALVPSKKLGLPGSSSREGR